jgi:hypothetical protein
MEDKILEFSVVGCVYTKDKEVSIDEFNDKFIEWVESMGWEFCGVTKSISDIVEEVENEQISEIIKERLKNDNGKKYTHEEVKSKLRSDKNR